MEVKTMLWKQFDIRKWAYGKWDKIVSEYNDNEKNNTRFYKKINTK